MRRLILKNLLPAFSLIMLPLLSIAQNTAELYLAPGEQKVIALEKASSIAIGNQNIVEVKFPRNRKRIILLGKNPGLSNIIIWGKSKQTYTVKVIPAELKSLFLEVTKSLKDIDGIKVDIIGQKIAIDGTIFRSIDKDKITGIAKGDDRILDLTKVDQNKLNMVAAIIKEQLSQKGFSQINAVPTGRKIHLSGLTAGKDENEQILEIALSIFPFITHSLKESFETQKMILVDIKMAEIRKSAQNILGINWQDALSIKTNLSLSSGGGSVGTLSLGDGFETIINMLSARGYVKILSNPKLLCKDGKETNFQAGGEIPIRLIGERNSNILFKNYGLILKIRAITDREDNISVDINAEISDINFETAVEGIPGFIKNSIETSIDLPSGNTIILAGLIENKSGKTVEKLPFFGHIPILGELFKSRNFRNNRSEFSIFLTPSIINASSKVNSDSELRTGKSLKEVDRKLKYSVFD